MGLRECAHIGLINPADVQDGTVVQMPKAYPVYDQQYHESIATVRAFLTSLTNLQTIGRNGLHRYNNQDHSMLTGVYAARNIMGEANDVWSVNTEQSYHEDGDVAATVSSDRLTPTRVEPAWGEKTLVPDEIDEVIEAAFAKLDPSAFGIAVGVVSSVGLLVATAVLLLRGEHTVGSSWSLLGHYLLGVDAMWAGSLIGLVEIGLGGFFLGYVGAGVRNWGMDAYAFLLQRRTAARMQRNLLDQV